MAAFFLPLMEFLLSGFRCNSCKLAATSCKSWIAQGMGPCTGQWMVNGYDFGGPIMAQCEKSMFVTSQKKCEVNPIQPQVEFNEVPSSNPILFSRLFLPQRYVDHACGLLAFLATVRSACLLLTGSRSCGILGSLGMHTCNTHCIYSSYSHLGCEA